MSSRLSRAELLWQDLPRLALNQIAGDAQPSITNKLRHCPLDMTWQAETDPHAAAAQLFSATSELRLEAWISTESVAVHSLMERIKRQPELYT